MTERRNDLNEQPKTNHHSPEPGVTWRMSIRSIENRLDRILGERLERIETHGRRSPGGLAIAREIYESEPALMEELKDPWMLQKLAWLVNRKLAERWRTKYPQVELPGFEGMDRTIILRNGRRPRLDYCRAAEIEDHIKLIRVRFEGSLRLKKMEALLELMHRYTPDDPDINWSDVKRKELERRDFERLVGS
jgi:hypothetical protein